MNLPTTVRFQKMEKGDLGTLNAIILLTVEHHPEHMSEIEFLLEVNSLGVVKLLSQHSEKELRIFVIDLGEPKIVFDNIKKFAKDCIKAHNFLNNPKGF